jgi:hypothetical protein
MLAALASLGCAGSPPPAGPGGLGGKHVVEAAERLAPDLLAQPVFDEDQRYAIVLLDAVNNTRSQSGSFKIFTNQLEAELSSLSGGRVSLVSTIDDFRDLRREAGSDPRRETLRQAADFGLIIEVGETEDPREPQFYQLTFRLTDVLGGQVFWARTYNVAA